MGHSLYHFGEQALRSFVERITCPVLLFVCSVKPDRWEKFRENMQKYPPLVKNITVVHVEGYHRIFEDI
jgi:hypothetical protein